IALPEPWRDDRKDPAGTIAEVRRIIAGAPAEEWKRRFYDVDCCCSIVLTLDEAIADPHFAMRRLFDHILENEDGAAMTAVPVAVAPPFRDHPLTRKRAAALGAHNDELLR